VGFFIFKRGEGNYGRLKAALPDYGAERQLTVAGGSPFALLSFGLRSRELRPDKTARQATHCEKRQVVNQRLKVKGFLIVLYVRLVQFV
jgi:hypothetical protein